MANILYVGNFQPGTPEEDKHSTENHIARALRDTGHSVTEVQENDHQKWKHLRAMTADEASEYDFMLWTRTWDKPEWEMKETIKHLNDVGLFVVGYHLDRWWGLSREHEISEQAFFTSNLLCTADGGHQEKWEEVGIDHVWMPPAVSETEARGDAYVQDQYRYDVVFAGKWRGYHPEWQPYRTELIGFLRNTYGDRFAWFPKKDGAPYLRGQELRNLYASGKVFVGDSCLSGGATRYWSDRIPETLGRTGYLIHPEVEGLSEHFDVGIHLATYPIGDFPMLKEHIDFALEPENKNLRIARAFAGKMHTLKHHTYEARMRQLIEEVVPVAKARQSF